uniref:Uncharacterized protein n=1 Tax=Cannabis sativa TaxID=3483 RepID=A0A803PT17_CANSA
MASSARKRGAGGFYYLGTHTNDQRIIVRLPNKTEFKDDFFWTSGLAAMNTTAFTSYRQVPMPANEEDKDYMARINFLKNIFPQEAEEDASQDMNFESLLSSPPGSKKVPTDVSIDEQVLGSVDQVKFSGSQLEIVFLEPSYPLPSNAGIMGSKEAEQQKKSHKTELEGAKKEAKDLYEAHQKNNKELDKANQKLNEANTKLEGAEENTIAKVNLMAKHSIYRS